jgi:hypothetical protein
MIQEEIKMKKIVLCVFFAAVLGGVLLAQDSGGPGSFQLNRMPERITLSGSLGLSRGRIALESGGTTYFIAGIDRLIGFVDGLKEGASVSLEGWAFPLPRSEKEQIFRAAKLSFNGKDYELDGQERLAFSRRGFGFGRGNGFDQGPGFEPPSPRSPRQSGPQGKNHRGRRGCR